MVRGSLAVQVTVEGVDDEATATAMCIDLLAVLPVRIDPPTVTIRNTPGLVIVAGESGACGTTAHP